MQGAREVLLGLHAARMRLLILVPMPIQSFSATIAVLPRAMLSRYPTYHILCSTCRPSH
jgi:hypothetical protein